MAVGSISAQLANLAHDNPPYTKDEEEEVTNRYFFDDHAKWRELIVLHNIRFCISFSRKYFSRASDSDDIIMMAVEGMMRAADDFEPTKGYRFTTYCSWKILHAFAPILNTNFTDAKTNSLTLSILDNPVSGKDGNEKTTLLEFIGNVKSPDSIQIDPSEQYESEFDGKDFNDLLNHMCGLIIRSASNAQRMHKDRMDNVLNAFRMKFGCSGYGERGLSDDEIAERIGVSITCVQDYIKDARALLNKAFEKGISGTEEYSSYNCINEIFRKHAIRTQDRSRENRKTVRCLTKDDYVYDSTKGSWILNVNGAAQKFGYVRRNSTSIYVENVKSEITYARGRIRSSSDHVTMLLEGSEVKAKRSSRKKLNIHYRGIRPQAPAPLMKFPTYTDRPCPKMHVPNRTRKLPETCASCVHNPACSSWIGGCEYCGGSVFRRLYA